MTISFLKASQSSDLSKPCFATRQCLLKVMMNSSSVSCRNGHLICRGREPEPGRHSQTATTKAGGSNTLGDEHLAGHLQICCMQSRTMFSLLSFAPLGGTRMEVLVSRASASLR